MLKDFIQTFGCVFGVWIILMSAAVWAGWYYGSTLWHGLFFAVFLNLLGLISLFGKH